MRWDNARNFLKLIWEKAGDDNIFFLAGAIAFNVLVAFVPMAFGLLGIAGMILRGRVADPGQVLQGYLRQVLPTGNGEFQTVAAWFGRVMDESGGLTLLSTLVFIWFATRLVGTLRTALREVFDVNRDRGIVAGKIFDFQMLLIAGLLFSLNVALTYGAAIVAELGLERLGFLPFVGAEQIGFARFAWTRGIAVLSLWIMFVLIYRFLPARRPSWRTSLIAATFAMLFTELLREVFGLYVANFASYTSTYGTLVTVIVTVLWIYYTSMVFILGGEIAQVAAMQRVRKRQKERLR